MDVIRVTGGNKLSGTVQVEGAKNSVLKLMAATILAPGVYHIDRVPQIADVTIMAQVLKVLGAGVEHIKHELTIDTSTVDKFETPYELVKQMRASIAVLGPLLGRFGKAVVAMPGGCQIGERKLDLHLLGLEALGVKFELDGGYIYASAPNGLVGADVSLDFASVGATENLMMAATCAQGTTVIENAACEPEIVDLANMLVDMGAKIMGAGTPVITIEGVEPAALKACDHTTVGDRIEAGTYLVAGALCQGPLTVTGFDPSHLSIVLRKLEAMGVTVEREQDRVTVSCDKPLTSVDIQTLPYPGFPTDMQAQFMILCSCCEGDSIITENVFENRFMVTGELMRMGCDIRIEGHHALVKGQRTLSGAPVSSTDLRGGAALVLAGLIAQGVTEVSGIKHIDRGYERLVEKLRAIGAQIERVTIDDE